jgi:hypothetical protein
MFQDYVLGIKRPGLRAQGARSGELRAGSGELRAESGEQLAFTNHAHRGGFMKTPRRGLKIQPSFRIQYNLEEVGAKIKNENVQHVSCRLVPP